MAKRKRASAARKSPSPSARRQCKKASESNTSDVDAPSMPGSQASSRRAYVEEVDDSDSDEGEIAEPEVAELPIEPESDHEELGEQKMC